MKTKIEKKKTKRRKEQLFFQTRTKKDNYKKKICHYKEAEAEAEKMQIQRSLDNVLHSDSKKNQNRIKHKGTNLLRKTSSQSLVLIIVKN